MTKRNQRIAVGMSGGVDSSVAAYLLTKAEYDVEGIFMKNWEEDDKDECNSKEDFEDAKRVCRLLDIKLNTINFSDEYWTNVFEVFISDLKKGFTPNPDVFCNKEIKFNQFYKYALSQGFDLIATGHYAKKVTNINSELHSPTDRIKDQTYFLYTLDENVLRNTVFPLEQMTKDEVKKIATNLGFGLEEKKESMGICFIGKRKFSSFIDSYVEPIKGPIINYHNNQIIGTHEGLSKYTIGQRKGINIGGLKDSIDSPWYVIDKNINENSLIVSQDQSPLFYTGEIELGQFNAINKISDNQNVKVRFRHGGDLKDCVFSIRDNKYIITLKENERGIAQGQAAVLYIGTRCIGGGTVISKCLNQN
jgi:tRNA-specific 2-thiouridylase